MGSKEQSTVERMVAYMQKHPGVTARKVYSAVNGSTAALMVLARKQMGDTPASAHKSPPAPAAKPISIKNGKTFEQFRKDHDVTLKIREGLKKLQGVYMSDNEFRDFCGVHVANWRRYADLDEFRDNKIKVQGITHWAQPAFIKKMKEVLGIAI